MSIMLYVYSKIFCVLTSRQSRLSKTEVSENKFKTSRISSAIWFTGMRTCHRRWNGIYYIGNWHKLPPKLEGLGAAQPSRPNNALRASWIRQGTFHLEKQSTAWQQRHSFAPRKFCYSLSQLGSIQSESVVKWKFVNQIQKKDADKNFITQEGNKNSANT